jgi:hypothetical protein
MIHALGCWNLPIVIRNKNSDDLLSLMSFVLLGDARTTTQGTISNERSVVINSLKEDLPRRCVDDYVNAGNIAISLSSQSGANGVSTAVYFVAKQRPAHAFDNQGCRSGPPEIVIVEKVDNHMACVQPSNLRKANSKCWWVRKSNLATLRE